MSWPRNDGDAEHQAVARENVCAALGLQGSHGKTAGRPFVAAWWERRPRPTLCHKPCTVSGGGKSEISKPISDAIIQGPVFVADFERDFEHVNELIKRDYSDRFRDERAPKKDSRPILSSERSLGSVIKLLTPIAMSSARNTTHGWSPCRSTSRNWSLS